MLSAVLQGVLIGLTLAIMVGPYFLFLINTSLSKGKVSANYLALGVAISDIIFLSISAISMTWFLKNSTIADDFSWAGALFILAFGIFTVTKKPNIKTEESIKPNPKQKIENIIKGFVFNGLNPSVFVFWFATVGTIIGKNSFSQAQTIAMLSSIVITTFTCDFIKIRLAVLFSPFLKQKFIKKVNVVVGSIFILIALYLLSKTFFIK